jgi:tRNA threonylcarbamoyladenosine biosynthesis protein TsaE
MIKISKNVEDTKQIAKEFSTKIKPNNNNATIVGLYGELGAGKTTFTQFFGKELGIKRKVNSPTFVIMKKYVLPKNLAFKHLFHLDAYRLKNEKELIYLGWKEIISNKENLVLIEWPEQIIKAIPKKHYQIFISHTKQRHRKFRAN